MEASGLLKPPAAGRKVIDTVQAGGLADKPDRHDRIVVATNLDCVTSGAGCWSRRSPGTACYVSICISTRTCRLGEFYDSWRGCEYRGAADVLLQTGDGVRAGVEESPGHLPPDRLLQRGRRRGCGDREPRPPLTGLNRSSWNQGIIDLKIKDSAVIGKMNEG